MGRDSTQHTCLLATRRLLPVRWVLWPRRTPRSGRSPRGNEQPSTHEPRRGTSPRLAHPRPLRVGPKPVGAAPYDSDSRPHEAIGAATSRCRARDDSQSRRRSVMVCSRVTLGSPAEAGLPRGCTKTQQAAHPHTPDTGSRCPSAAEATPGHESHLAPPRGRSELSCALTSRSWGEHTTAPDTSSRMTTRQTPTTRPRGAMEREPRSQARAPRRCTSWCCAETQPTRTARITGAEDTFPRFGAFQRNQTRRSLRDGLPHRHHPLSGFLALSAV